MALAFLVLTNYGSFVSFERETLDSATLVELSRGVTARAIGAPHRGYSQPKLMPEHVIPPPIERYFAAKGGNDPEMTLDCFTVDATVWDNGEDLELKGIAQIREWLTRTVAGYKLTSEIKAVETRGKNFVASVVVSGDFPGSPYEFAYQFKLQGDRIAELTIDPIGSAAP